MKLLMKIIIVVALSSMVIYFSNDMNGGEVSKQSIYDIKVNKILGEETKLSEYKGKILLIVNTASQCGFTPQYKGLQEIYDRYNSKGFEVLGFPCNQFGSQEPGSSEDIKEFCELNYSVTFPMFEKINVNGPNAHPLYEYLKNNAKGFLTDDIKWNFTKFLVDQEGNVVKRYGSNVKPNSIAKDIEDLL